MPYIKKEIRADIDLTVKHYTRYLLSNGELNYLITKLLLAQEPSSYEGYNSLIGVLECCKLEFYRRAVSVYEDQKIKENGDVF
jgi:hypothetical protein